MLRLIIKNLLYKKLSLALVTLTLVLGTAMISLLLLVEKSITGKMDNDLRGIDMVIGAKGSPMQLVLSAIYQTEAPTGNIPLAEVEALRRNPMVDKLIPLAYGDGYQGSAIVGTTPDYMALYDARLASGRAFEAPLEVVAGAAIAKKASLQPGSTFSGLHGGSGEAHDDQPYTVVGVLTPTGTVIDHLLLTPIASVWAVHNHATASAPQQDHKTHEQDHEGHEQHEQEEEEEKEEKEITAALVTFKTPMANITLPRIVNNSARLQAANPVVEIRRLLTLMSIGTDTLRGIALAIMVVSALGIFIALYTRLRERRYELALMRTMGCPRSGLLLMLLGEGVAIAFFGAILGLAASRLALILLQQNSAARYHLQLSSAPLPAEAWLLAGTVALGAVAALLPAVKAFHLNISKTLANG